MPPLIYFKDGDDNTVKQIRNITLTKGVYNGHFKLSKYPPLGLWTIKVVLEGNYDFSKIKTFKVWNYHLPKFSVFIKAPSDVVLDDGSIRVAFFGKYTFNKYVEGNAMIKVFDSGESLLAKRELYVDRLASVEFKIEDFKNFTRLKEIKILVELTEKNTGKTESDQKYIGLHKQRYNIEIPWEQIDYKDNKPFRLKAIVKHLTGAAVLDYKTPVTMLHGDRVYESFLDKNGAALFEFEHQEEANHVFQFKDSKTIFPNIYTSPNLKLNAKMLELKIINEK